MPRERAWRVSVEGFPTITTSELTLDEAALVERVCEVPYTLMNPHASVKVAKGLLVVLLKRSLVNTGVAPEVAETKALETAGSMTLDTLHGAFTFEPGDGRSQPSRGGEDEGPPASGVTSTTG